MAGTQVRTVGRGGDPGETGTSAPLASQPAAATPVPPYRHNSATVPSPSPRRAEEPGSTPSHMPSSRAAEGRGETDTLRPRSSGRKLGEGLTRCPLLAGVFRKQRRRRDEAQSVQNDTSVFRPLLPRDRAPVTAPTSRAAGSPRCVQRQPPRGATAMALGACSDQPLLLSCDDLGRAWGPTGQGHILSLRGKVNSEGGGLKKLQT